MTSKTKGLLVLLGTVALPVSLFTFAIGKNVNLRADENHKYVINLDSSNQISESGDHNVKTILGNDVSFYYSEVGSPSSGDHVHLNQNGHIYNSDHLLSIKSISAVFTGYLEYATGNSVGSFGEYTAMTSGVTYTVENNPYYFDLFAKNAECHITSATIEFYCAVNPDAEKVTYQKVTSDSELTSGNYIVVYETGGYAFDATKDSASNRLSVTIANSKFDYINSLANAVIAYDSSNGSLKNANGKYLYHEGTNNSISFGDNPAQNSIEISGGDAYITYGGYTLRYNPSSGQNRFRYYSGTTQKIVQLYKATNSNPVYAKSITLSADSTSLYIGEHAQVSVSYNPEGTTVKNVTWNSSNETVATVDDSGLVNALTVGNTTITATVPTAHGTTSNTIEITVSKKNVTGLTLNKDKTTLYVGGDSETLVATIAPSDASVKTVNWTSSDSTVATVVNGVVTPVKEGTTTITATSADNANANDTCLVTVEKVVAPTVSECQFIDKDWGSTGDISWDKGKSGAGYSNSGVQVTSTASGANATTKILFNDVKKVIVTYCTNASKGEGSIAITVGTTSYGSQSVTTSGGTTGRTMEFTKTPVASGKVKIEVTCSTNSIYIIGVRIECVSEPTDPTGVSFEKSSIQLVAGGHKQLDVSYTPSYANQNLELTWDSSNKSVATVNESGYVTVAENAPVDSTTTITAQLSKFPLIEPASLTITVVEEEPLVKTDIKKTYKDYVSNNIWELDSCPTNGNPKLLIVPIWFTDSSSYINSSKKSTVRSDIEKAYLGSTSETGWHSVKSFYQEESKGTMNLTGVVTDWYECGKKSQDFYEEEAGADETNALVETVVEWYFSQSGSDSRKSFDTDGNGYLDGIMLIYGSPDSQVMSSAGDNMWAYCYWLQESKNKNVNNPGPNVFFWASYDFMYDSSTASSHAGSSYANGDCSHSNIDAHTFIHEMGHVLGLEDYYDYGQSKYSPAGGFSMQDYNIGGHDPYSVMSYGWTDPYIPTDTTTITIGDFQDTHDIILLTPEWNQFDSPFDEYLLLELYTPTGLNQFDSTYTYTGGLKGPTKTGIRLWHIDARLTYVNQATSSSYKYNSNNITTNPSYTGSGVYGVCHAFSNSYSPTDRGSVFGSSYNDYDILHLIRRDKTTNLKTNSNLSNNDLFIQGDEFIFSDYASQFPVSGTMNNGKSLGWKFTVDSITGNSATITVTKL